MSDEETEEGNSLSPRAEPGNGHSDKQAADTASLPAAAEETAAADVVEPVGRAELSKSVSPVPETHATPIKRPTRLCAKPRGDASAPGAGTTPNKATPSKATPSKATPSKRGREAVGSSPGQNAEHGTGVEEGLQGGTPGKRRRNLLPPLSTQVQ